MMRPHWSYGIPGRRKKDLWVGLTHPFVWILGSLPEPQKDDHGSIGAHTSTYDMRYSPLQVLVATPLHLLGDLKYIILLLLLSIRI